MSAAEPYRRIVVAEAERWIGTPYRHQGSTRGVGCDCLGLVLG
ncbi:MAG: peptidase P60, partial [Rhizobiaceae bacterium]